MNINLTRNPYALNDLMELDHVIRVYENGVVIDDIAGVWAPEVYDNSAEGGIEDIVVSPGWTLLHGFTGQYSYSGPCMHPSEYVGGHLARHILDTPGYWVVVEVRFATETDDASMRAVAFRDA